MRAQGVLHRHAFARRGPTGGAVLALAELGQEVLIEVGMDAAPVRAHRAAGLQETSATDRGRDVHGPPA